MTSLSAKMPRASEPIPELPQELRSIAYNILRCNQSNSIPQDRFAAALGRPQINIRYDPQ